MSKHYFRVEKLIIHHIYFVGYIITFFYFVGLLYYKSFILFFLLVSQRREVPVPEKCSPFEAPSPILLFSPHLVSQLIPTNSLVHSHLRSPAFPNAAPPFCYGLPLYPTSQPANFHNTHHLCMACSSTCKPPVPRVPHHFHMISRWVIFCTNRPTRSSHL